jgi:phospholipid transport system substrate-binding protein
MATARPLGAAAMLVLALAAPAGAADGPREVVRRLGDRVLAVLRDGTLPADRKRERIMDIAKEGVDFDTLARLVLGRNAPRFSPDELARFREEFRRHLSVTYGNTVEAYKDEDFEITGDREEARGDWTVKTTIRRAAADVLVDYRLRRSEDVWKIIDFVVEGVSLVSNFRSQFQELLSSRTPSALISLLQDKNARGESVIPRKPPPS